MMRASARLLEQLAREEWDGTNGRRLMQDGTFRFFVYQDYRGFPTFGVGHLVKPGDHFEEGGTLANVLDLYHHDLAPVEVAINALPLPFALNQNQFDSMVCTAHNTGIGYLDPKWKTGQHIRAGNLPGYLAELITWNKVRDKSGNLVVDAGLTARRKREAAWFQDPVEAGEPLELNEAEKLAILHQVVLSLDAQRYEVAELREPDSDADPAG